VLEPQSTALFLILMVVFGGLVCWMVIARHVVFRVLAACLAFIPAMLFGVAAVNKYYNYYQTWGAIAADLSSQGAATLPKVPQFTRGKKPADRELGLSAPLRAEAAQTGYLFQTQVTGQRSRITRTVFVYLPPQYFQKQYGHYRFPVLELLHGSPGDPEQWVSVMNVIPTFTDLIATRKAAPVVLVMPDTDGGRMYSLQCLNAPGGIQDETYLAVDVPDYIAAHWRVQPPGRAWGLAGYSEGGYCTANIALQEPRRYGYAGVLSGYFSPSASRVPRGNKPGAPPVTVNPFRGKPALRAENTPRVYINQIPPWTQLPQFWLAAGRLDGGDVRAAVEFRQLLMLHQAVVPLDIVGNGAHNATVWRAALRPMLTWMTPKLAQRARSADAAVAAAQRRKALQARAGTRAAQQARPPGRRGKAAIPVP
jgi:enterochelin esterase-like enzyme